MLNKASRRDRCAGHAGAPARRPKLARHTGNPQRGTGSTAKAACEDNSELHRVRTGQRLGNRDTDGGRQGVLRPTIETAHAADRRVQGPPAKTTPTSIASGPAQAPSQARVRQPDTDGDRQAVPRADRWTDGASCAFQPPPVWERAHDRSRKSYRLRRHEGHRQDIGGLYDHVRPHQRCERSRSLLANERNVAAPGRCPVASGAFRPKW